MTIASEISRLQTAKADIKTAIENKWVEVWSSIKLDYYHDYIDQIEQNLWHYEPWEFTATYYKLEEDANDYSWHWANWTPTDITYTTLSTWKKVAVFNWSSSGIYESATTNKQYHVAKKNMTYSIRFRIEPNWQEWYSLFVNWPRVGTWYLKTYILNPSTDQYTLTFWYDVQFSPNIIPSSNLDSKYIDWWWHNLIRTADNSIFKLYIDWVLYNTIDYTSYTYDIYDLYAFMHIWYYPWIASASTPPKRYFKWNLSEQITERRTWTYDDVMEYYSNSKYDYIS